MKADQAMQLAVQNHRAGRLAEAGKIYREILLRRPNHPDALHLLGDVTFREGKPNEAIELVRRAIAFKPANAIYHNTLGYMLHENGEPAEAVTSCRQAISLKPDYAEAHNNLANSLLAIAKSDEAMAAARESLRIRPDYAEAHNNLGTSLRNKGQFDEAIAAFEQAIRFNPDMPQAHANMGNTLLDMGLLDEAIAAYQHALRLNPNYAKVHNNLARVLCDKGQLDEAIDACRQAIKLKPDFAEAHNNLAVILKDMGQIDQSIAACRHAVALQPGSELFHSNLLLIMHYDEKSDPRTMKAERLQWGQKHADPLTKSAAPHTNDRSPDRRLKIGFISADFRNHPVARFFLPLLESLNADRVEHFCYAQVPRPDPTSDRIRARAHHWLNIVGLTDQQVADQIRNDKIDVLIDLAGHTGGNRLLVFARKPAPVQAAWLGYPDKTGLAAMDYRLTDPFADPPEPEDTAETERLIHLPRIAWCCHEPIEPIPLDPQPIDDTTPITFGSFNNFSKITRSMLELWAEILRRAPGSNLLIKAKALGCRSVRDRVEKIMDAANVQLDRLTLQGWHGSHEQHLASYRQVHIALDTFPYHGTTTTCEALWMGVPTITLAGRTHLSRVGVSLLSNIGLPELIADTPLQYVKIAAELAKDTDRLNRLRSSLRQRMRQSPLMDAPAFARDMESACRLMWHHWCSQQDDAKRMPY